MPEPAYDYRQCGCHTSATIGDYRIRTVVEFETRELPLKHNKLCPSNFHDTSQAVKQTISVMQLNLFSKNSRL